MSPIINKQTNTQTTRGSWGQVIYIICSLQAQGTMIVLDVPYPIMYLLQENPVAVIEFSSYF